jgi:hypothetical protein
MMTAMIIATTQQGGRWMKKTIAITVAKALNQLDRPRPVIFYFY